MRKKLILNIIQRAIFVNVKTPSCKSPVVLGQILIKSDFLDRDSENTDLSNFIKILPARTELLYADGQTYMRKLVVANWSFSKAPKTL